MATKRIVVCGGNGFVGSRICKFAVARGWDVMSISRSGQPRWDAVSASSTAPSWARQVSWERANLLDATTYRALLTNTDYVVHSMGILLETDYKGLVRGTGGVISGLRGLLGGGGTNPLERGGSSRSTSASSGVGNQPTYESMNRDSAITLAREAAAANAKAFAFISAATCPPGVPTRYLSTKLEAEQSISKEEHLRGIFIRAPFMYDSSRKLTLGIAAAAGAAQFLDGASKGLLSGVLGDKNKLVKPLLVDTVAQATVQALEQEDVSGGVGVEEIERLGEKYWRQSML
ncbi:MIOREX complex component 2 [Ceratocystis fimbriata CBS 114723]|uniref:MIOREX complex component 2 n=1 Tax=Ceratocystis fimbriata CBS 114723 TaxID=1035309 RepID=A0A2C5X8S5_9PEZI|nr:MIOREX complex component 2 [Ceratocystis fimbriata CBS 114723]